MMCRASEAASQQQQEAIFCRHGDLQASSYPASGNASSFSSWQQQTQDVKRQAKRLLAAPQRAVRAANNRITRTGRNRVQQAAQPSKSWPCKHPSLVSSSS